MKFTFSTDELLDVSIPFATKALAVFNWQAKNCEVYKIYLHQLKIDVAKINSIDKIPFLPILFFKSQQIISNKNEVQKVFESSGTTGVETSKHFITDELIYQKSLLKGFELSFGNIDEYCILALLPSYLERNNSSLVYMVQEWMNKSKHPKSGFYLDNFDELNKTIIDLENAKQKTILIGVTYALLDFAEKFAQPLHYTKIIETGGMKGKRKELLKEEVHQFLAENFSVEKIYSEYGMTEMLSQCYSLGNGKFTAPPWVKILVADFYDPFQISDAENTSGCINVIDLANVNSCSFIATDDIGKINADNTFEILGRKDNSAIRGCNLLID